MVFAGVDQATLLFRRVLKSAASNERARVDALMALAKKIVFAPLWPGQQQYFRTLTNPRGQTATPLFTGRDMLEFAADTFDWRQPDGTVPFREIGAREAVRHAIAHGSHFVILDLGADHCVEFSREEIEPLLGSQRGMVAAGQEHALTNAVRRASSRPAPPPESFYPPGAQEATPPKVPAAPPVPRGFNGPLSGPETRPLSGAPAGAGPDNPPPAAEEALPLADTAAFSFEAPTAPHPIPPPTLPVQDAGDSDVSLPSFAPPPIDIAPEPLPPAPDNSMQPPAMSDPELSHAPAPPTDARASRPGDATQDRPSQGEVDRGSEQAAALAQERAAQAAQQLAAGAEVARQKLQAGAGAALGLATRLLRGNQTEEQAAAEQPDADDAVLPLSDEALDAISDTLRKYPEVEWAACMPAGDGGVAEVALRIDPSFMTRSQEISQAMRKAASGFGETLNIDVLDSLERAKECRSTGEVFFPGRRRSKR